MEFYSHVDKENEEIVGKTFLKEHLQAVANLAQKFVLALPIEASEKRYLTRLINLVSLTHDFGKYTTFFQDRLFERKNHGKKADHGFISAVFSSWIVFLDKEVSNQNKYAPLIAYFTVLHHHGNLGDIEKDIPYPSYLNNPPSFLTCEDGSLRSKLKAIVEQIKDLKKHEEAIVSELKTLGLNIESIQSFDNAWIEHLKRLRQLYNELKKTSLEEKIKVAFQTLTIYSCLIDADKRDAGKVSEPERKNLPDSLVDEYKKKVFSGISETPLIKIRNEIYQKVMAKITSFPLERRLLTLTAPTGSGKTLTAFSAALKLRKRIENKLNYKPRIIYALPFINIIEQNYAIIKSVLKNGLPDFEENETQYLLKHHHLADISYKTEGAEKPLDEALLLTESWEAEIVVTTFVQLLHTLIGFKNSFLKKFHNIAGSIIILDEVQNIPLEYWKLVRNVFLELSKRFKCYILLLTATKPLIFLPEDNPLELVDNHESYFKKRQKVKLIVNKEIRNIDELIDEFIATYDKSKSYLMVLNTISSSIEVYKKIKNELALSPSIQIESLLNSEIDFFTDKEQFKQCIPKIKSIFPDKTFVFYLSTNIIPKQRKERVALIKYLLEAGYKPIVVSTQVVEAGVDLDFDEVWRDIGPLDSIIQVAGRCNREERMLLGKVIVFNLNNMASFVYGKTLPPLTRDMLFTKNVWAENEFFDLINTYFNKATQKVNIEDCSNSIWQGIILMRFQSQVSKFTLIEKKGNTAEIFVEFDSNASYVWQKFCQEVVSEKDFKKRKKAFLAIKRDFNNYLLSILLRPNAILPPIQCGYNIRTVSSEEIAFEDTENIKNAYYSKETGFIHEDILFAW
ncbi:CRISPR-associated helicase Cas3' [Desulfonauticus submarinus]